MLSLGPLALIQPWLLAGLLGLPLLYWLLRLTPPAPKRIAFPPLALIRRLVAREETPARTPLWLLLLRLAIAALIILALAQPVLNPAPGFAGRGPLIVVIDNGWASAPRWPARMAAMHDILGHAEREAREVILIGTAPGEQGIEIDRLGAAEAIERLAGLEPRPWPADREAVIAAIDSLAVEEASTVWLSDGIAMGNQRNHAAARMADRLRVLGPLTVFADEPEKRALLLDVPLPGTDRLNVKIRRAVSGSERPVAVQALGPSGEVLAKGDGMLEEGQSETVIALEAPPEMLNRFARLELVPGQARRRHTFSSTSAGDAETSVIVAPPQSRRGPAACSPRPYYVERALTHLSPPIREGNARRACLEMHRSRCW